MKKLGVLFVVFLMSCGKSPQGPIPTSILMGDTVGNGGIGIVCRNEAKEIVSVRVLDLYEARTLQGLATSLGAPENSVNEKVERVLTRLQQKDPVRGTIYRKKAKDFWDNAKFEPGIRLADTKDYGYLRLPSQCKIEQLCIQKPPAKPDDKLYTLSLDYWDRLDPDHQAALILHEIVYGEALSLGHKDSVRTRRLVGTLTSSAFEKMTAPEYSAFVTANGFTDFTVPTAATPVWSQDVIYAEATSGTDFSLSLLPYVSYSGVRPLLFRFAKSGGPSWFTLGADGLLSAKPDFNTIVQSSFEVEATDGASSSKTWVKIYVFEAGKKKEFKVDLPDALVGKSYTYDIGPELDKLGVSRSYSDTGQKIPFLTLDVSKTFLSTTYVGTPQSAHVGRHEMVLMFDNVRLAFRIQVR